MLSFKRIHDDSPIKAAADFRERKRSAVEILRACLDRIERYENQVHAWISIDREGALNRARELDAEFASGRYRGPLHGIPIGVKDIVDLAGTPTAAGYPPWRSRIAREDAPLVRKLRELGAIVVGKTVTTQFAAFDPPVTLNPRDPSRTPGGSSSGSAAAVATGMCLAAIGSQTGGSIVRPASFCGVVGFKPSYATIDAGGFVPLAPSLDHPGFITPTSADQSLIYHAINNTGKQTLDQSSDSIRRLRVGRPRGFFDRVDEPEAATAVDLFVKRMIEIDPRRVEIVEFADPIDFDEILARHRIVMSVEAANFHRDRFREERDSFEPKIASLIEAGLSTSNEQYQNAKEYQNKMRLIVDNEFRGFDAWLVPATTGAAPDRSTTGDPRFQSPFSFLGVPTISFPVALTDDGLPLSVQWIGARGGDETILSVCEYFHSQYSRAFYE